MIDLFVTIAKFLSVIVTYLGLFKSVDSLKRRSSLREEYKFAKEFITDVQASDAIHPLLLEKGGAAISGLQNITAEEVAHLLQRVSPSAAMDQYGGTRGHYVQYSSALRRIEFIGKFKNPKARRNHRAFWLAVYITSGILTLSLLLFVGEVAKSDLMLTIITVALTLIVAGTMATYSLLEISKIRKAELLVLNVSTASCEVKSM